MTIHDHFEGSAHCVECKGYCRLAGDDLAVTRYIRFTLEILVMQGWKDVPVLLKEPLRDLGLNSEALMRRAVTTGRPMTPLFPSRPDPRVLCCGCHQPREVDQALRHMRTSRDLSRGRSSPALPNEEGQYGAV